MNQRIRAGLVSIYTAAAFFVVSTPVFAESLALGNTNAFGVGWEPKPLVDPSAKPSVTQPQDAQQPQAQANAQNIEQALVQALKPVMPFIESVEGKLFLKPAPGTLLSERLKNMQTVLFGEIKYQDAGELLAKMAELFPEEAAKAQSQLKQQMATSTLKPIDPPKKKASKNDAVSSMPQQPAYYQQPQSRSSWMDDDSDDFFNERSRNDDGSSIKDMGRGLMSLAAIAGGLAGSYYLNKKMGGNDTRTYDPYYNPYNNPYRNPYYYPPNNYNTRYYPNNGWYSNQWAGGLPPGTYPQGYNNYYGYGTTPQSRLNTRRYNSSPLGIPFGL